MNLKKELPNRVVLGGGTAGWLTALTLNKLPAHNSNVILIESDRVPSVGAGEGTTPNIVQILKYLQIPIDEFFKRTRATKKVGIDFSNWNGDGKGYDHLFAHNTGLTRLDYAFHFDSIAIITYLKEIAIQRGVIHMVDHYQSCKRNQCLKNRKRIDGDIITHINLRDYGELEVDTLFDCSGFARLIIGKEFKTKWINTEEYLPVNSAIPFTLPQEDSVKGKDTVTRAVAMKYGWLWMIPLQSRWGCGYVHDGNLVSEEDAKKEIEEYIGKSIFGSLSARRINFKSGYYEKPYVGNVIAIGLSSGFFEPLEATSLATTIKQLFRITKHRFDYDIEENNNFFNSVQQQILWFLTLHYMSNREDTEFWINHKTKELPEGLLNILDNNLHVTGLSTGKFNQKLNLGTSATDREELIFTYDSYKCIGRNQINKYPKEVLRKVVE